MSQQITLQVPIPPHRLTWSRLVPLWNGMIHFSSCPCLTLRCSSKDLLSGTRTHYDGFEVPGMHVMIMLPEWESILWRVLSAWHRSDWICGCSFCPHEPCVAFCGSCLRSRDICFTTLILSSRGLRGQFRYQDDVWFVQGFARGFSLHSYLWHSLWLHYSGTKIWKPLEGPTWYPCVSPYTQCLPALWRPILV